METVDGPFLFTDLGGLAGEPEPEEHGRDFSDAIHQENLFDENESQSGELTDMATGKPFDNSSEKHDDIHVVANTPAWDDIAEAEIEELAADPARLEALIEHNMREWDMGRTAVTAAMPYSQRKRRRQLAQSQGSATDITTSLS